MQISLNITSLIKKFPQIILFHNLDFCLSTGQSLAITGPNGSGKSTLLQILAGLQKPTSGEVKYLSNGNTVDFNSQQSFFGFTAPSLNPYDDLTGLENIEYVYRNDSEKGEINFFLNEFGLFQAKNKKVKYYSSGMKQRLKIICALINNPPVIIFDEPGTNLDNEGKIKVYNYLNRIKKNKILIAATNDEKEAALCDTRLVLG